MEPADIVYFLSLGFLNDDLIRKARLFDILDTRHQRVNHIQLASGLIVCLRCHTDNQIIPQLFCPFQQPVMSLVEKVKGTIGNYFYHIICPFTKL